MLILIARSMALWQCHNPLGRGARNGESTTWKDLLSNQVPLCLLSDSHQKKIESTK